LAAFVVAIPLAYLGVSDERMFIIIAVVFVGVYIFTMSSATRC